MRDFAFIHSAEDVTEVLELISAFGLIIRRDEPTPEPAPRVVDIDSIPNIREGLFAVYLQSWVFAELSYNIIDAGYRKGMYDQKPSTNCVKIQLSFREERREGVKIRLGNGYVSRDVDWYKSSNNTIQSAPVEVKIAFEYIIKSIDTKKYMMIGGRRYAFLKGALEKIYLDSYLPPFDFMDNEPIRG